MKMIFTILILVLSCNVFASEEIVWSTIQKSHPLWEAMEVKAKKVDHDFLNVLVKEVAGIKCERLELLVENPILASEIQYHCYFPEAPKGKDILKFFNSLNTASFSTSGAYTEIKLVDKLIVVGDTDTVGDLNYSRFYLDHPCQEVTDKKSASKCMEFWATEILPSFEDDNNSQVVVANSKNKQLAKKVLGWDGRPQSILSELDKADYIGLMGEYQDELHFYYFILNKGENSYPQEIMDFNLVDLDYSGLGDRIKKTPKGELQKLIDEVNEAFFIGLNPNKFPEVRDELAESIEYLNEGNQ